jgi:peptidoglycan/LPS O-acetylase OafA/YrhL
MRSSSGAHFIALDHVRALAAFMVFAWHFIHASNGYPIPFGYVPAVFPFAVLDEGHTGVALFMTLSGYLFAKLLDGKAIHYGPFLWNRALRLLPLLFVVLALAGVQRLLRGADPAAYVASIARGVVLPTLPNGGWSITVEFHYYLVLPVFLWLLARSKWLPLTIVVAAVALRALLRYEFGEIQWLAFWTLVGRVDQFALGMLVYQFRAHFARRHLVFLGTLTAFLLFYWYFDLIGGFYRNYPSPNPLWIVLPTIEGLAYAIGIAWYDSSFSHVTTGVSRLVGRIGEYSYSIYLLHFFVVFQAARFVDERILGLSNFYVACGAAALCFVLMMIPAYLSYRFIEAPFLRLRKRYVAETGA